LVKRKQKDEDLLKGDKLRDLILLVHLNNSFGKGKNDISELKEKLSYSTGGIYNALDQSGYFERTPTGIKLTEKGEAYLRKSVIPQYDTFRMMGYIVLFIGVLLMFQWIEGTYFDNILLFPWYSDIGFVLLGLFLIFILRIKFVISKRKRTNIEKGK
jgi:hypothetical protein